MEGLIVGAVVGLFVGWWFVPQPEWAKKAFVWLKDQISNPPSGD